MKRLVDGGGDAFYNASILKMDVEVPVAKTVQVEFRRLLAEKEVRENRRITQVEVAAATGLSRQTLGPWVAFLRRCPATPTPCARIQDLDGSATPTCPIGPVAIR